MAIEGENAISMRGWMLHKELPHRQNRCAMFQVYRGSFGWKSNVSRPNVTGIFCRKTRSGPVSPTVARLGRVGSKHHGRRFFTTGEGAEEENG